MGDCARGTRNPPAILPDRRGYCLAIVYQQRGCGGKADVSSLPTTPELGAALVRSVFCGLRDPEKRVAAFIGYSDETEQGDDFFVGGYLGIETAWPYFADAWIERVLRRKPSIPYLHMVEIRRKAFQSRHKLSLLDVEDKISEAARVVKCTGDLVAITSTIDKFDLPTIVKDRWKRAGHEISTGINKPDFLPFIAYAHVAVTHVSEMFPQAERVDLVVSRETSPVLFRSSMRA
jgi:hypothetical protein